MGGLLKLTYSAHAFLPDGATLLAVVETTTQRRWFRTVETSRKASYVLKGGAWWNSDGPLELRDPRSHKLSEIAMMQVVRASVDAALE